MRAQVEFLLPDGQVASHRTGLDWVTKTGRLRGGGYGYVVFWWSQGYFTGKYWKILVCNHIEYWHKFTFTSSTSLKYPINYLLWNHVKLSTGRWTHFPPCRLNYISYYWPERSSWTSFWPPSPLAAADGKFHPAAVSPPPPFSSSLPPTSDGEPGSLVPGG